MPRVPTAQTSSRPRPARHPAAGRVVLVAGLLLLAGSVAGLAVTGRTELRYSADHDGTVAIWTRWVPALVGIALVRLLPSAPATPSDRPPRVEAWVLLAAAVLFAVGLRAVGGGEPAHTLLKLPLLLGVPLVLFRILRRRGTAWVLPAPGGPGWAPAVPVAAWLVLTYATPWAPPADGLAYAADLATLVLTLAVVFAVNALLEEVFYRRWLQSRWEALVGPWPAITLASVAWAGWHVGIQGTRDLPTDLASSIVSHGGNGLFLGYLWSRFCRMWPLLVVHGATNAAGLLLSLL